MIGSKQLCSLMLSLLIANQAFARPLFYSRTSKAKNGSVHLIGDKSFSYTLERTDKMSRETLEKGLIRILIERSPEKKIMIVERRTTRGFLYETYLPKANAWESVKYSIRPYATFFKDSAKSCSLTPIGKNPSDLTEAMQKLKQQSIVNFSDLVLGPDCKQSLTDTEYSEVANSLFMLLGDDPSELDRIADVKSVKCVRPMALNSTLKTEFESLRARIDLEIKSSSLGMPNINDKAVDLPLIFPINCSYDGSEQKKEGILNEGQRSEMSLDVSTIRNSPGGIREATQEVFLHEFAHTIRVLNPKTNAPEPLPEMEVKKIDQGDCQLNAKLFPSSGEIEKAKEVVIGQQLAQQTGQKYIAAGTINPYSDFLSTSGNQAANVQPSRGLASVASESSSTENNPTRYQAVKGYVDRSISAVSRRIEPVAKFVESPAYASETVATTKSAPNSIQTSPAVKRSTASETAPSSAAGTEVASGGSSKLGNSSGPSASLAKSSALRPDSKAKSANIGLENVYALRVRQRLTTDADFRQKLRSERVSIEFSDGYKFETVGNVVSYIEVNGKLIRRK